MANNIVTTTVNEVTWKSDNNAYGKVIKQIRSVGTEWEKAGKSFSSKKNDPAEALKRSAVQGRLIAKRLQQTERTENSKTTAHNIALAKKEARVREIIAKRENARRVQAVRGITSKDPELSRMKDFYKQQQKASSKVGVTYGTDPSISAMRQANLKAELARRAAVATAGGVVGDVTGGYRPGNQDAMQRETYRYNKARKAEKTPQQIRAEEKAKEKRRRDEAREDERYSRYLAGKESTVLNAGVRLRAKYGDKYATKMGGYDELKERFLNSNTMKSSNFRAELAAMETGMRQANAGALTLSEGMGSLRRSLISATAAYSAFSAGSKVLQTGQFFQGMEATMLMVSDDSVEAGKRMQFVKDQAYRLGLELKTASQGYTQMSIAAEGVLTKSQNNDLFKSFSEYSTALQVDPVKYQRGITALQQMMGKGQIMSEELKQQLAEGIPGSLQVFLKATREAFGDLSIDIPKMMKMMEDGELKAAKVMPFVAKYYAEAANKGGALNKALQGNRVAMERLRQTWMNFQNDVFQGGFGQSMTDAFNDLAGMLSTGGPLASAVGEFAGGIIDSLMAIVNTVYNIFVTIDAVFQRYIPEFRRNGEEMGSAFKWLGWAMGAGMFAMALKKVFTILSMITGLSGGLKFLSTIFGDADVPDGGDGKDKKKGGNKKWAKMGNFLKMAGIGGTIGFLGQGPDDETVAGLEDYRKQLQENQPGGLLGFLQSLPGPFGGLAPPTFSSPGISPTSGGRGGMPLVIPTEPVSGEIKITLDAGEMEKMFDTKIEAANMSNINLLLGVPQ